MYFYSAKNNSFYTDELKAEYDAAGSWPDDAVAVTNDDYLIYISLPPTGKVRAAGKDGLPTWIDIPPLTPDQEVALAENQRTWLLTEANDVTADWRTELALDIISDEDKSKLIAWMQYIKAVKAVDASKAPNITWPAKPSL